jgi:myo-inositol-1(or 4)-monophosphatase
MPGSALERELAVATEVAREAGALLKQSFGKVQEVDFKGRINLVTEMDLRSEALIVSRLKSAFPGDDILAEEGSGRQSGRERVWIVDPLDGTTNYAHEYPVWAVSIALQVAGIVAVGAVYNPLLDDMYAGRRGGGVTLNAKPRRVSTVDALDRAMLGTGFAYDLGRDDEQNNLGPFSRFILRAQAVRRAGSAALAIAKVAVGRSDGFWERGLSPWDMAGGMLLVEEGGGRLSDYDGRPPRLDGGQLVASNGLIHDEMLGVLKSPDGARRKRD